MLTGAITVYETPTEFFNCSIDNNFSEDALNIIRSHFEIDQLTISNTYSDGFDADFCTGTLSNANFSNTGNDCIDFSGSQVQINDVQITNSGDKGISGGEASDLILENIAINGAITGIAAKDGTTIEGANIQIDQTEYACAAFRKKPEYSGASIAIVNTTITESKTEVLVELDSEVILNGSVFLGKERLDIEALYARFE